MTSNLKTFIASFNLLSIDEITEALQYFELKNFKKGEPLIQAGKTCNWIAFINSGLIRNFYTSSKDEEVTYCITFANTFISAYSSFITGKPTFENIEALADTEVLLIHRKAFKTLVESNHNWLKFSNHFAEQSYVLMENRLIALQKESADKRYRDLMANHPKLLKEVPLKHIASYLGITQRHLSRLRRQVI